MEGDKKIHKPKQRTSEQNRALHLFLKQKSIQCRDAGITVQKVLNETIELEMTETFMKEIWREVQKALYGEKSTTKLTKTGGEIAEIVEHLNRFFSEQFNLEGIDFPHDEEVNKQAIPKPHQVD